MANKHEFQNNLIIRESIFLFIVRHPGEKSFVINKLLKSGITNSKDKIESSIKELVKSRRILEKNGNYKCNPDCIIQEKCLSDDKGLYFVDDNGSKNYLENAQSFVVKDGTQAKITYYLKNDKNKQNKAFFLVDVEETSQKDKQNNDNIVYGRVMKTSHDKLVFFADDKRFKKPIIIMNDDTTLASFQDKICVMKINEYQDINQTLSGYIVEVKGDAGNPIIEYEVISENHGATMSWSDDKFKHEIENAPKEVDLKNYQLFSEENYEENKSKQNAIADLRHLKFTTVDPVNCKDMDDAIYSTFDKDGNLVVYTAVADVSKYIDIKSEIGKQYLKGCFTTYAPNRAYNILPPEYSTNICSLNPNVDRLALVVKSTINPETGVRITDKIMEAVIQSKGKYSYEQAQNICDNNDVSITELYKKINNGETLTNDEQIIMNKKSEQIITKAFKRRNNLQFNSKDEYRVILNEDMSDIIDIVPEDNCAYHKVIEKFMITANEALAEYAIKNNIPNVYRVHSSPLESKTDKAYEFFKYIGVNFNGDLSNTGIKKILNSVKGKNKEKIVNNFLIRLQNKAKYSIVPDPESKDNFIYKNNKYGDFLSGDNVSHFGLQSKAYSHSTSPIRRVPDYITHNNILSFIHGDNKEISGESLNNIIEWANYMEKENRAAEREFNKVNSVIYCSHHIGDVMKGRICAFKRKSKNHDDNLTEIMVIVENEDKGIEIEIPLIEILASQGKDAKKCSLSKFGSAVIDSYSGTPILTLCGEIDFKITSANRITKEIVATTDIYLENDNFNFSSKKLSVKNNNDKNNFDDNVPYKD